MVSESVYKERLEFYEDEKYYISESDFEMLCGLDISDDLLAALLYHWNKIPWSGREHITTYIEIKNDNHEMIDNKLLKNVIYEYSTKGCYASRGADYDDFERTLGWDKLDDEGID